MALVTLESVQTYQGTTYTGANAAALTAYCAAIDDAIKRLLAPYYPEPKTLADIILDAPPSRELILPVRPARSITSVYYNPVAHGLASNFTADHLIDNTDGDEYQLTLDAITGRNERGILRRVNRNWGYARHSPNERLGYEIEPERGAIKISYLAGPTAVPPAIASAAFFAALLMYQRRERGAPMQSESENGYSYSLASAFTADAAIRTPEVMGLLKPFLTVHIA